MNFSKILRHPATVPTVVGLISFGTGIGVGIWIERRKKVERHDEPTKLKLNLDADDIPREQTEEELIAETTVFLRDLEERQEEARRKQELKDRGYEIATPAEVFILDHLPGTAVEPEPEPHPIEIVAQSIFAGKNNDWDYDEELKKRTDEAPYVIHRDEFYAEEAGFVQTTMTYYAGDDCMADQEDALVYNYPEVVGPLLFGHGSDDPNIFYVRNVSRREEWEIIHDDGHYSVEVLGLEMQHTEEEKDIKHYRTPKFRPE